MTSASARRPDNGDDSDVRYDPGRYEAWLAIIFADVLVLDVLRIEKYLACDLEVQTALAEHGVALV